MQAPTVDLLTWIAERPRTYAETMDVWHRHCPRLLVWEDALADGLVAVSGRTVALTESGNRYLAGRGDDLPVVAAVDGLAE